jgi:hypothetical protein
MDGRTTQMARQLYAMYLNAYSLGHGHGVIREHASHPRRWRARSGRTKLSPNMSSAEHAVDRVIKSFSIGVIIHRNDKDID